MNTLHAKGVKLAVVSSKPGPILEKILERQGAAHLFDFIIGADAVEKPKPDPAGILAALKTTGLTKDQVLYCGDTVIDAEAAKKRRGGLLPRPERNDPGRGL